MFRILTVLVPLGVKFKYFNLLGFEGKSNFDHKTSEYRHTQRELQNNTLNDKNPIHGREIASFFDLK